MQKAGRQLGPCETQPGAVCSGVPGTDSKFFWQPESSPVGTLRGARVTLGMQL